jgi:hypothetical protein
VQKRTGKCHTNPASVLEIQTLIEGFPSDHYYGPVAELMNTPANTKKIAIISAMSSALNFISLSSSVLNKIRII